jgi:hypothetical protein
MALTLGKSTYLANAQLNYTFGESAFVPPSNYYLGLFTAIDPTETEVTAPEYVRAQLPNTALNMPVTVNGEKFLTSVDIPFTEATTNWGIITHFVLFDAATAGNVYYVGEFDTPITVNSGVILNIKSGRLKIVSN